MKISGFRSLIFMSGKCALLRPSRDRRRNGRCLGFWRPVPGLLQVPSAQPHLSRLHPINLSKRGLEEICERDRTYLAVELGLQLLYLSLSESDGYADKPEKVDVAIWLRAGVDADYMSVAYVSLFGIDQGSHNALASRAVPMSSKAVPEVAQPLEVTVGTRLIFVYFGYLEGVAALLKAANELNNAISKEATEYHPEIWTRPCYWNVVSGP
jgi:hypothetical protein